APPEPKGTSYKDTSVNIATAFNQAATGTSLMSNKPLSGGSSRSLRRGPSLDRLPAPPAPSSKGRPRNDDEEDDGPQPSSLRRAMSPLMEAGELASRGVRAVSPAFAAVGNSLVATASSIIRSHPQGVVLREPQRQHDGQKSTRPEESYDYEAEEALANTLGTLSNANGQKPQLKRKTTGRPLDEDNRLYQPPPEESESSEDDTTRSKVKGPIQRGLVMAPPPMSSRKRSKRKSGPGHTAVSEEGSRVTSGAGSSNSRAGSTVAGGSSAQPSVQQPLGDEKTREEDEIDEVDEEIQAGTSSDTHRQDSYEPEFQDDGHDEETFDAHSLSIGARLGKVTNIVIRVFLQGLAVALLVVWRTLAAIYELLVQRPRNFIAGGWTELKQSSTFLNPKTIGTVVLICAVWYNFSSGSDSTPSHPISEQRRWFGWLPSFGRRPIYTVPDAPVGSIDELVERLRLLENAFVTLEQDHRGAVQEYRKGLNQIELESRSKDTLATRLISLETKLEGESRRAMTAEENTRTSTKKTISSLEELVSSVRGDVVALHALVSQQSGTSRPMDPRTDERIGVLEKELRDVSERLKVVATTSQKGKSKPITTDGKDLADVVRSIVARDGVGMADYASYYTGAVVDTLMTSPTHIIGRRWMGLENIPGRPPVTALLPDVSVGSCWPITGSKGQLGIRLSRTIYLTHITIDHPPRDLLHDSRSAPRKFHVWIHVEGIQNSERAQALWEEMERRRAVGGAPELPQSPPGRWNLLHVGSFEYDINAEANIQTFEIPAEYQALKIDTGAMVVSFESNWGHPDLTCIYRVRAHGTQADTPSV
ncbi:hypothetical protein FRB99_003135, partial [Tulasnella sp. 403]